VRQHHAEDLRRLVGRVVREVARAGIEVGHSATAFHRHVRVTVLVEGVLDDPVRLGEDAVHVAEGLR